MFQNEESSTNLDFHHDGLVRVSSCENHFQKCSRGCGEAERSGHMEQRLARGKFSSGTSGIDSKPNLALSDVEDSDQVFS